MGFAERQIEGALLLQKSEALINFYIERIAEEHSNSAADLTALKFKLLELSNLAKKFGSFESIHETTLKDG